MAFERPEAVTVARQMDRVLPGKIIQHVALSQDCTSLIRQGFVNLDTVDLTGKTVGTVTSQGKWIFVRLEPDWYLTLALESSGKLLFQPVGSTPPEKFRLRFAFGSGEGLTLHLQGWGFARAARQDELKTWAYPGHLGLDPLDASQLSAEAFERLLAREGKKVLKAILTDQRQIAGIGIGYCQEILYRARLHPKRKAGSLAPAERAQLLAALRDTLGEAVSQGGSASEVDLFGHPGGYQRQMGSHLLGLPCPRCGTIVEKVSVAGGACHVCPGCQKLPPE
jgi:formamidopyrimidine-DNA glycosylase